jgi:hypothetical protein
MIMRDGSLAERILFWLQLSDFEFECGIQALRAYAAAAVQISPSLSRLTSSCFGLFDDTAGIRR